MSDRNTLVVGLLFIVAAVIGFWALMKMILLMIPLLGVVAMVGFILWIKNKS